MSLAQGADEIRSLVIAAMPEQLAHDVNGVRAALGLLYEKIQGTANGDLIAGATQMYEGLRALDAGLKSLADGAQQVHAGANRI